MNETNKYNVIPLRNILPENIIRSINEHVETWVKAKSYFTPVDKEVEYRIRIGNVYFIDDNAIKVKTDQQIEIGIKNIILDYFNLEPSVVFVRNIKWARRREKVQIRQLIMVFILNYTRYSLAKTGQCCGGYDHATVLHAKKTVKNLVDTDRNFRKTYNFLDDKIYQMVNKEKKKT